MGCQERKRLRDSERAAQDAWLLARSHEWNATGRDLDLSRTLATRAFVTYERAKATLDTHDKACGCVPHGHGLRIVAA